MGTPACEIEVKYRVDDLQQLLIALASLGVCLSSPSRQDDQAYAEDGWNYGMDKRGVAFARLRTQAGRHLFTLKKPQENEMACLEHETEVLDRDQMHHALVHMGFRPTVRIVKTRRDARFGSVNICVDEVDHLGAFLEIEAMAEPDQSGVALQDELDSFARSLGVPIVRTTDTYDSLLRSALIPA